ncbi:MAG TPA: nuclear transport factor 2 family protein [Anaerolineaceae bacterium]
MKNPPMSAEAEILALLRTFQDGYTRRDLTQVDAFMNLFTPDAEVIGTNGVKPCLYEWYLSREAARDLVYGDWQGWGDLRLDLESASIHSLGEVGWIAAVATVTQTISEDNYAAYLNFIKEYIDQPGLTAEQKLLHILRGGTNTVYELRRGEKFIWPLRFTAVVVRQPGGWKFAQVNFSFPTIYFPDVRDFENQ